MIKAEKILFWLSVVLISAANFLIFTVVPTERQMGAIQRIFYFHVGSAITCYLVFGAVFVCSLGYLFLREEAWDAVNEALAEVGFLFCTITLASGMIWAKTAWNIWFRWEPRLVTFLLLWLLFLGFLILRQSSFYEQRGVHSSVLGILGALVVPLVWLSVELLPQAAQLHPQVVEKGGLKHPLFTLCFVFSIFALSIFAGYLVVFRSRLSLLELRCRLLSQKSY